MHSLTTYLPRRHLTERPLIRATFPRAFIDANREPFELDQNMFSDRLPDYVNTKSGRVAAGLGTIPRIVSGGKEIYSEKLTFSEAATRIEAILPTTRR